jgi:hypothetical protein
MNETLFTFYVFTVPVPVGCLTKYSTNDDKKTTEGRPSTSVTNSSLGDVSRCEIFLDFFR